MATEGRKITAEEQQQEFCSYLGFQSETIWDEYDSGIHSDVESLLLRKINLIFGDEIDETIVNDVNNVPTTPSSDGGSINGEQSENLSNNQICKKSAKNLAASNEKFKKIKDKLVEAIWKQRKYNKDILLMSPIFVALVTDYGEYAKDITWCKYSLNYTLHPVFRIIKCRKNGMSHGCCMIFVDEHARVYQNWDEFKANNDYSAGYLVAPTLGVYNTNENIDSDNFNRVMLDVFPSSCITTSSKLAATADTVTAVGGLAATGVTIASIVSIPMLPIIAAGALGLGCAAYSVGRSTYKLIDRSKHEQTVKVSDTEARSHWFGIASGAVGLGAGAATKGLASAAGRGASISKVGEVVTGSVNMLNGAAILMNGVGTLNGIYAIFLRKQDGEDISMLEILQFSSSLFIFTHSVYNFQTASSIVRSSRAKTIGEYRLGLSRSQQKAFDKLVKETIRQKGVDAGNVDVIRSLRNIQDTKQFFGDAYKVNKELNKNNVKMSLHPDGEILLNDARAVDPTELRNTLSQVSSKDVFANLPTIPESHPAAATINLHENKMIASSIVSREHVTMIIGMIEFSCFVRNQEDLKSAMIDLAERVTLYVFDVFVDFMRCYFTENCRWISESLGVDVPFEHVFRTTLDIILQLANGCGLEIGTYVENIDWNFLRLKITDFYTMQRIRREMCGQLKEQNCKICSGTHFA